MPHIEVWQAEFDDCLEEGGHFVAEGTNYPYQCMRCHYYPIYEKEEIK